MAQYMVVQNMMGLYIKSSFDVHIVAKKESI